MKRIAQDDVRGSPKRYRAAVVTSKGARGTAGGSFRARGIPDDTDYFNVPFELGPQYAFSVHGK